MRMFLLSTAAFRWPVLAASAIPFCWPKTIVNSHRIRIPVIIGRSLQDLVHFLDHLRSTRVELFLHQQGLDTTSPAGRAMFGMLSVFSEFERAIIQSASRPGWLGRKLRAPRAESRWAVPGLRRQLRIRSASCLVWRRLRPPSPCGVDGSGA